MRRLPQSRITLQRRSAKLRDDRSHERKSQAARLAAEMLPPATSESDGLGQRSDIDLLGDCSRVIDLDAEVSTVIAIFVR